MTVKAAKQINCQRTNKTTWVNTRTHSLCMDLFCVQKKPDRQTQWRLINYKCPAVHTHVMYLTIYVFIWDHLKAFETQTGQTADKMLPFLT